MAQFIAENLLYIIAGLVLFSVLSLIAPVREIVFPLITWVLNRIYTAISHVTSVVWNAHLVYLKNWQPRAKVIPSDAHIIKQVRRM